MLDAAFALREALKNLIIKRYICNLFQLRYILVLQAVERNDISGKTS